jgi:hypothetical protein
VFAGAVTPALPGPIVAKGPLDIAGAGQAIEPIVIEPGVGLGWELKRIRVEENSIS